MGSVDRDEERSFKDNFSGEGVAKLREIVSEKLKEFMGDDTDDTLVEYVIVLLRNGRRKREAKTELNVFLGNDDSDSFVSWLWDHLSSTLELYVQPAENHADKEVTTTLSMGKRAGRDESPNHIDYELEKGKSENLSGNRHKREWKGLERDATEPPPLRSSVVDVRSEEKTHHKSSRRRKSLSPDPPQQKKRSRHDEHHMKRESVSQAASAAPRRLLQSAVRDAVGNLRQPVVVKEPSQNRLRSVVSASIEGLPLEDPPRRRLQSIARVPNPMASVIRAVQEAADDVRRVKSSGSVFDRLGHGVDISETTEQVAEFRDASIEEGYEEFNQDQEQPHPEFHQRIDRGGYVRNLSLMDCETGLASDLVSENEGYTVGHGAFRVSQIGTSGGSKGGDSLGVKYSASRYLDRALPTANTSSKTVTVSSHVDARKPLHYQQDTRNATETFNSKFIEENEAEHGKSDVRLVKENSNLVVSNGNAKPPDIQSQSPKTQPSLPGSFTAGRPSEDADSRTIFVCNVHFAATKDSLSRHFNKFGEVLKVVIVTDASTGQPKGSAYVEFMRKEAADNALSLDNTSFMSRILKITKRSSSNQEAPPVMTWPHISRGSPYAAARFSRAPFPRGIPGAFRARPPMRMGTRSFQWKRDTQPATDDGAAAAAAVPGNTLVSPNSRGLTYVRPESRPDGSTGTT